MSFHSKDKLTDTSLFRLIFRLGLPAILGLSANAINQFVDALWITRLSPFAMASIGVTFPIFMLATAATVGFGAAVASVIGRRLGQGDTQGAENASMSAMVLAGGIAIGIALLLLWSPEELLKAVGASEHTYEMARQYLILLLCATPLVTFQIISDFCALGSGNSKWSMIALFVCFGTNMVLDPIFIFGFGWGVTGAALATIAGQVAACVLYVVWFRRGSLGFSPFRGRFKRSECVALLRLSPPMTIVNILTAVSFLLFLREIARLADDTYVAALTFDLRLMALIIIPVQGLALGAQAAVSHAYGAQNHDRCLKLVHRILLLSVCIGCTMSGLVVALGPQLLPVLIPSLEMQQATTEIFTYLFGYIAMSCVFIPLLSGFQAMDRAAFAAIVALAPNGYIMLPLLIILPNMMGLTGVLWVPVFAGIGTAAIAVLLHGLVLFQTRREITLASGETA
ncbi:MAG: MATE family efflux transporter [Aliishimia sp.]